MLTWIEAHPDMRKDAARIAEAVGRVAVGRVDWLLHMMMMSSTNYTVGIEH
jgi:hypothetical protein